ncbi:mobilization protein [Sedimentitalea sp. CY04]|uniref:Mobilization protein n=1 Tax=Parasedimentitalea denitrificans TaxID=2211118 RepID=A0ABX0WDL7_9RHOB|nr:mobilization protein [Sedimentitalea sp. CY04]NIZ62326.1 mobilization protein [Sedimentitalea sp. CY04]
MLKLDQKIDQAKAQLGTLQAQARKQRRKDEARRKILFGAAVLALLEELNQEQNQKFLMRLSSYIKRETDRKFLGLPHLGNNDFCK